jgi:predicted ATPase
LRQLIEAQIETLTREEQHTLEAASIIGKSFAAGTVSKITGIEPDRLLELVELPGPS